MNPRMPKGAAPKLFLGVHARLAFLKKEDEQAVLDLMRRFSSATRFAYNRLLEGQDRKELKREDSPLCRLFGLNTRYADGAIEKAQATLDSAKELGQDPRKVVFGGRKLFEQLKRKHLSGKDRARLRREWKEKGPTPPSPTTWPSGWRTARSTPSSPGARSFPLPSTPRRTGFWG
jgi:predicted transposase